MDQIVVRSNHRVNSIVELQVLMDLYHCKTIEELTGKLDKNQILRQVCREETGYAALESEYLNFLSGQENAYFEWGYVVSPGFALCIGEHISFCHLDEDTGIFPWRYMDRGVYIADNWWYEREEIQKDATSLTLVEFLLKYW